MMTGRRLADMPRRLARRDPAREALVFGEQRLSYRQLADLVDDYAAGLLALGVKKGDRVVMLCTPRPEFLLVLLASLRIGALWLGLGARDGFEQFRHVIADARPKILFALPHLHGAERSADIARLAREHDFLETVVLLGEEAASFALCLDDFLARGRARRGDVEAAADAVLPDDEALIIYTSGTTGRPKGAVLTQRGLMFTSAAAARAWPAEPMRILCNLPINHIGAIGSICGTGLVSGGTIVFMENFDAARLPDVVADEGITVLLQVPAMFRLMVDAPGFARQKLAGVQQILWGGGPASPDLLQEMARWGGRLQSFFGMSETSGTVLFTDPADDLALLAKSVGRPVAGCEVRLVRPDGTLADEGELCLRAPSLMRGYLGLPEASARAIDAEGWLHSGDLARRLPDGSYQLVGRLGDMFKSGGYNVYPREVEAVLEAHPAVAMAAVIGVDDALYHQVGRGFVVLKAGAAAGEEDLRAFCRARLANYKTPKRIILCRQLPLLANGKIDKQALRAPLAT
jgi:fatty-acyl-CoA synthase